MGAGNVKSAYALYGDLPHAPMRVLLWMALRSMDAATSPTYWGGREELAYALGRKVPPAIRGDREITRQRNAAFKAVRDATALLTRRKVIYVIAESHTGQRREWGLNLSYTQVHPERAPEVHGERAPLPGLVHGEGAPF